MFPRANIGFYQLSERGIMPEDVIMILWTGETIERYPDDTP